jgi:hypothetical protein
MELVVKRDDLVSTLVWNQEYVAAACDKVWHGLSAAQHEWDGPGALEDGGYVLDDRLSGQFGGEDESEVCADSRGLRIVAHPERLDPPAVRFVERRIRNTRKARQLRSLARAFGWPS